MEGGTMRRHLVDELRSGSFADGQTSVPPDTALVGRFCTGQEHPHGEVGLAQPARAGTAVDGGHTPAVIRRNDRRAPSA
jgi:hypothetical protein